MSGRTSQTIMTRLFLSSLVTLSGLAAGCSSDSTADAHGEGSVTQRQDAAMKDPFSYGPTEGKPSSTPADPGTTKRDDSLKGQMDRFWNP